MTIGTATRYSRFAPLWVSFSNMSGHLCKCFGQGLQDAKGRNGKSIENQPKYPNVPSNIPISSESPHLGKVSRNDAKHRRPNFWIFILTATGSHPQQHGSSTAMTRLHRKGNKCHILSSCMTHGTHCQSCLCSDLLQAALPWRQSVKRCTARSSNNFPPSLEWSCSSWAKAWQVVVLWWA